MIDPGQIARQYILKHWPKFGSILVQATYRQLSEDSYDAITGDVQENLISTSVIDVIVDKLSYEETKNESYTVGDIKIIFPSLSLSINPKIRDQILMSANTYVVMSVSTDPAVAVYELILRKMT